MWVRTPATATVFKQEYCTFITIAILRYFVLKSLSLSNLLSSAPLRPSSVEAGDAALALVDVDVTAYFLMLRGVGSALLH